MGVSDEVVFMCAEEADEKKWPRPCVGRERKWRGESNAYAHVTVPT